MATSEKVYDCAIIGGGLAGLSLAIQLADQGLSVVLFEKNQYPFHKVCGEYISMESYDFLHSLGVPFGELNVPFISRLGVSSEQGFMLEHKLSLGGFGISRYRLDHMLSQLAVGRNVTILENCRVQRVHSVSADLFEIQANTGTHQAKIACGSYGKYDPQFVNRPQKSGTNYIGVKYHIQTDLASDRIELHNFKDGYCGVSKVEDDWYCFCYLTTAQNLVDSGKDIRKMEAQILSKNPHLQRYFSESIFRDRQPLVTSNVHFSKKSADYEGIFLLGDAAGSITPLCGNGMSMALRGSKMLASELAQHFLSGKSVSEVRQDYFNAWNAAFNTRINAGYYLQNLFGKRYATHLALKALAKMPFVMDKFVGLTHGKRF